MRYFGILILAISNLFAVIHNVPADVTTIQGAIDLSADGDTVLVHPGIYEENINYNGKAITVASLFLTTGVEIYIEQTIIDADGNGTVVTFRSNEDRNSILYGLSITGGAGEIGMSSDGYFVYERKAGGIYILKAQPTISHCHIFGNNVYPTVDYPSYGGGIMMYGYGDQVSYPVHYSPLIEYCKVYDNVANLGGGIYMFASISPVITHTLVKNNTSTNQWAGGGIFTSLSSPLIYRSIFKGNSNPGGYSGGIGFTWGGIPVVLNCTFAENSNAAIGVYGAVSPIIFNNIFKDNQYNGQPGGDLIVGWDNDGPLMYITQGKNIFDYDWSDQIPDFIQDCCLNNSVGDFFGVDPQFVPESMLTDEYLLLPSSPALDAGLAELSISSTDPNPNYESFTWGITVVDWEISFSNDNASLSWFYSTNNHNIFLYEDMIISGSAPDIGASEFDGSSPLLDIVEGSFEIDSDDDNVPNPGEVVNISTDFINLSQIEVANGVITLNVDATGVIHIQDECQVSSLSANDQVNCEFQVVLSPLVNIGLVDFNFQISTTNNEGDNFNQEIIEQVLVSLNQGGFPFVEDDSRITSAPAIADVNDDGESDIVFANYEGFVYALTTDGEILDGFPIESDGQIWGAPAIADLNDDGEKEIIITSKDEHLYILNGYGEVILDYDASYWLTGTPAIGNLDEDEDLEIVFGSFSSSGQLHAINMDGTDLPGFPIELNERISTGVSLADFNNDGFDDIAFGTESDQLWLIYNSGETAENYPIEFDNKFKREISILDFGSEKLMIAPNRNRNIYGIADNGEILFTLEGDSYEWTEASFLDMEDAVGIFVGSGDVLYGFDQFGENLAGWPINLEASIVSSPVLVDMDGDDIAEVICATDDAIHIYNLNGTPKVGSPIFTISDESYSSSLVIQDTDFDGDLEIILGTNQSGLYNIDLKSEGNSENYWNMYRGNLFRNGKFETIHTLSLSEGITLPTEFNLKSVYPNPFNASTKIEYSIPHLTNVIIEVLDIKGAITEILVSRTQQQGNYTLNWNADKIPSGIYFIQFKADNFKQLQKVTVIK